jgi:hypothetical protein
LNSGEGLEQGVAMGYKEWQKKTKKNIEDARERERNPETTLNPFTKIRWRPQLVPNFSRRIPLWVSGAF